MGGTSCPRQLASSIGLFYVACRAGVRRARRSLIGHGKPTASELCRQLEGRACVRSGLGRPVGVMHGMRRDGGHNNATATYGWREGASEQHTRANPHDSYTQTAIEGRGWPSGARHLEPRRHSRVPNSKVNLLQRCSRRPAGFPRHHDLRFGVQACMSAILCACLCLRASCGSGRAEQPESSCFAAHPMSLDGWGGVGPNVSMHAGSSGSGKWRTGIPLHASSQDGRRFRG